MTSANALMAERKTATRVKKDPTIARAQRIVRAWRSQDSWAKEAMCQATDSGRVWITDRYTAGLLSHSDSETLVSVVGPIPTSECAKLIVTRDSVAVSGTVATMIVKLADAHASDATVPVAIDADSTRDASDNPRDKRVYVDLVGEGDLRVTVDLALLARTERDTGVAVWRASAPSKPLVGRDSSGVVVALVMPVRGARPAGGAA